MAAVTNLVAEWIGGVRNWDYRYRWLRDVTLTLYALLVAGFQDEARAWREWLLRGGGYAFQPPDHVRAGRRAPADRVGSRLAPVSRDHGRSGSATRHRTSFSSACTAR